MIKEISLVGYTITGIDKEIIDRLNQLIKHHNKTEKLKIKIKTKLESDIRNGPSFEDGV